MTTLFLSAMGRIVQRVLVHGGEPEWLALCDPAPGSPSLPEWVERYRFTEDVSFVPATGHAAIHVAGEGAREALRQAGVEAPEQADALASAGAVSWSRRDAGSSPAWWGIGPRAAIDSVRERLLQAGEHVATPEGWLHARVLARAPEGGHEIGEQWHPLETGLMNEISFTKGCYTGQEVVARQDSQGKIPRRLVGLKFEGSAPETGEILTSEERDGCCVTSVSKLAVEGAFLALGYVKARSAKPGTAVVTASGLLGHVR